MDLKRRNLLKVLSLLSVIPTAIAQTSIISASCNGNGNGNGNEEGVEISNSCVACRACIMRCPVAGVLVVGEKHDGTEVVKVNDGCISCGACISVCPTEPSSITLW